MESLCEHLSSYAMSHSQNMDARELLRLLMAEDGDNPHSLAKKLNNRVKQPQLWKFLEGMAKEPRVSSMQPLADHYKIPVQAFYDPRIADEVAAQRFGRSKQQPPPRAVSAPIISDRERRVLMNLADLLPEDSERFEAEIEALAEKMRRHRTHVLQEVGLATNRAAEAPSRRPAAHATREQRALKEKQGSQH